MLNSFFNEYNQETTNEFSSLEPLMFILLLGGLALFFTAFLIRKLVVRNIIGVVGTIMFLSAAVLSLAHTLQWLNAITPTEEEVQELSAILEDEYNLVVDENDRKKLFNYEDATAKTLTGDIIQIKIDEYENQYYLFSDGMMLEPVN